VTAGPAARPPTAAAVPNVRRFLVGQGISNVGTFFQIVAQSLLVLDLTGSGLALGAAIDMLTFNFPAFYSSLVKLTFHGGATGFGVAESLNAITAVLGGFFLARRLHHPTMRLMALGCALLGVSMLWSAISPTLGLFLAGMPFFGAVVVVYTTVTQSLLQQHTPAEKQGRIMSLYMLGTMGTTPIGGLITGWITDQWSPRASLAVAGFTPLGCAAVVLTRSNALRPTALAG